MLKELLQFFKKPAYIEDENIDLRYRRQVFFQLLICALVINIGLTFAMGLLESVLSLDIGKHAIDEALKKYSVTFLAFAVVILAPILEELIFRGPMVYLKNKPYFKIIFWTLTIAFGLIHITNFEINKTTLLVAPLLVLPQITVGALLGFIRVKFGLLWAIGLHATYNFILLGPILIALALDIPIPAK